MSDYKSTPGRAAKKTTPRPFEYSAAPLWHNLLYALVSAGVIFGPLVVPGVTFVDVFLAIEAASVGIFIILLLAGMFRITQLFRRREQRVRHHGR